MAVNPNILSTTGLNYEGLVFATAMSSFIATMIMGLWANLPFGLWPGMGMNAYFPFTIVGFKGTGNPVKKVRPAVLAPRLRRACAASNYIAAADRRRRRRGGAERSGRMWRPPPAPHV